MLNQFQKELQRQDVSENTVQAYCRNARLFVEWVQATTGKEYDNFISEFDAREYKSYLLNVERLKPTSVNAKLQAVQKFANFLAGLGNQEAIRVRRQRVVASKRVKILDKSTLYRCRRWAANHASIRDAAIFEVLINTGLRVSELTDLCLDDIQMGERKGTLLVRNGKGGKSREVPLNNDARTALRRYIDIRPVGVGSRVFYGQRGPLNRDAVYKVVSKIGKHGAGIDDLTPHVLRHTAFTRMAKNGVDLTTIADLAGHSNVSLTARYYVHTSQEDMEEAVEHIYDK